MKTVKFGSLDSYEDLGLIRTGATIGAPEVKTSTVDIPGADGVLDLTEYFGEILYGNREISIDFQTVEPVDSTGKVTRFHEIFSDVYNRLHGKRMKIVMSEDPGFYYIGRVTVDEWQTNEKTGDITISCDCEPYKYKAAETVEEFTVAGTATKTFANLRKTVIPAFVLGAEMQISQGDATFTASAGSWSDSRLKFTEGDNELTFTGNGTVKVTYQERGL